MDTFGFHIEEAIILNGFNVAQNESVLIRKWEVIKEVSGIKQGYAELTVDDLNDLPSADSFSGYHLYLGSSAIAVKSGMIVRMDKDGQWHEQK